MELGQGLKLLLLFGMVPTLAHPLRAEPPASAGRVLTEKGWCCRQGKVIRSIRGDCRRESGAFVAKKSEAGRLCKQVTAKEWVPTGRRATKNLALTGRPKGAHKLLGRSPSEMVASLQRRISPGTLKILENPGHDPVAAAADCSPTVYMWTDPAVDGNVFFSDREFTLRYSVDCATGLTLSDVYFSSTSEALSEAESGTFGDRGSSGTYYEDAAAAGRLRGSLRYAAGTAAAGYYLWPIQASNSLNPGSSASETLVFRVITRPDTADSCAGRVDCIDAMARHIAPLIGTGITSNSALDGDVEAFRDGILERRVIGLELQREIERMSTRTTIACVGCGERSGWQESEPSIVSLAFCGDEYPTDYALLHELTHKVGFNTQLIEAYIDSGLWEHATPGSAAYDEYRARVERMTSVVAAAAFDRSRICTEY